MTPRKLTLLLLLFFSAAQADLTYPKSNRETLVDVLHGVEVAAPYRWLEDSNSEATQTWIKEQRALTTSYLQGLPRRDEINQRLTELWDYERRGTPDKINGRYYWFENSGLQNQAILMSADSADESGTVLLDPNTFSKDGTVSLGDWSPSEHHTYIVYSVQDGGSDWQTWKVRERATGKDLDDEIKWTKFCAAEWDGKEEGFYYCRFEQPSEDLSLAAANENQQVYYHRLGTDQSEDVLVYERPDNPSLLFQPIVSDKGRYLVIQIMDGCLEEQDLVFKDLEADDAEWVTLAGGFEAAYSVIDSVDNTLYLRTTLDAPMGRLVAVDLEHPEQSNWEEIIPEGKDKLSSALLVGSRIVAGHLRDVRSVLTVYSTEGEELREIELPGIGSVYALSGDQSDSTLHYSFGSFTRPATIYCCDIENGEQSVFFAPKVGFDPDDFTTEQVFVTSKDGTQVPMFISYRKDNLLGPETPAQLYAYGGFNISITPSFSVSNLVWMDLGGIFCVANLRGGGEYGSAWHEAGMLHNKQNVFDDFIAAAEHLIEHGYTSSDYLAIRGGSNGGLLIGACMNQRPDLYAVCLPHVGVMDMLRFHLFTIGAAWATEYGSPDDPNDFAVIRAYSPLHNLKPGTKYPATMISTAERDDRVVPAHSFKYAAQLQHCQAGNAPSLIRIESRAGHGAGKPTSMVIAEQADEWAFILNNVGAR